ncbi:ribulose-phosphate 3-epimerase, partial [Candidatus Woesearchaeota archaeon]|nr:ribulose-phosphate 3-epimerase [Candidatus Woesearchaeota archaeon]
HVLEDVDLVLIMTVNPGFGGQHFIRGMLPKIRKLKEMIDKSKLDVEIEVDGGINGDTARQAVAAGVDILVAGSYIYESSDPVAAINSLRNLGKKEAKGK